MKKYILLFLGIILLTGCSFSELWKENKKENNYKSLAKEEVKKYIKNKYNFDLNDNNIINTVLHVNSVNEWSTANDYSGYATITATYDNNNFKIYINYLKKDTSEYYDNYEQNIIIDAIKSYYCDRLNINEVNTKIYLTDEIVFDKHTNTRFSDVYSFIHNINNYQEQSIIILTTDELKESDVQNIANEFNNINLVVYKLKQNIDLNNYSNNTLIEANENLNVTNPIFNDKNELFVEGKYSCQKENNCKYNDYVIESLSDGLYIKSTKEDDIKIQKIDIKQIPSYQDILDKCGTNLQVKSAYKLSAKPYHNEILGNIDKNIYVYNTNTKLNNQYQKYSIFVNDETSCNQNFSKYHNSLKNGTAYIIVVE